MTRRRRSPFQNFVAEQPCCIPACKNTGPTDPHHEPPRGMGRGGDHDSVVPLCRCHHTQRHTLGVHTFWGRMGVDWKEVLRTLDHRFLGQVCPFDLPF